MAQRNECVKIINIINSFISFHSRKAKPIFRDGFCKRISNMIEKIKKNWKTILLIIVWIILILIFYPYAVKIK